MSWFEREAMVMTAWPIVFPLLAILLALALGPFIGLIRWLGASWH